MRRYRCLASAHAFETLLALYLSALHLDRAPAGFFKPRVQKGDAKARRRLGDAPPPPPCLQPSAQALHPANPARQRSRPSNGPVHPTVGSIEGEGVPDGGVAVGGAARSLAAKRLVVMWWGDRDIGILARSLAAFAPRGSRISVIGKAKPEACWPLRSGCVLLLATSLVW